MTNAIGATIRSLFCMSFMSLADFPSRRPTRDPAKPFRLRDRLLPRHDARCFRLSSLGVRKSVAAVHRTGW